jgi:diaminohydroxyphosphoribosylaminopyrimidine deaminase / 5-amino-6-(5-phosphoribosylamino)uracil reductase
LNDALWMAAAIALAARGRALSSPNPNVGCLLVKDGRVVGRGWTQPGGRPHAEAMALAEAGAASNGATAYVTLEPCAHVSDRGPSCTDSLIGAKVARVVAALEDPDPRTRGQGLAKLVGAAVATKILEPARGAAARAMEGWLMQQSCSRPFVTLKLAMSLDGMIARADGESRWITGDAARAHAHLERARANMILVGRGTFNADAPKLDVRLPGLEARAPQRVMLSSLPDVPPGWTHMASPQSVFGLPGVQHLLIEGGAQTAAAFLKADLVDRLLLYQAPILIGAGKAALGDIGLGALADAHGRWHQSDTRTLGSDRLSVYERSRKGP